MNTCMQDTVKYLMKGAYDLHTHTEPSPFPRALDDMELIREAEDWEMAGVMIKAHYGSTTARAALINRLSHSQTMAYGGLALNWPTGGLNPYAVEHTLKTGGIIIWMPTRDSRNCLNYGDMPGDFFKRPGITIFDDKGQLLASVLEILEIVKSYHAYLATGHLDTRESLALCRAGRQMGVSMILTHPEWCRTVIPGEIQKEFADMGVLVEKNWLNVAEGNTTIEEMAHNIRMAGCDHVYLATDRGQIGYEHPAQAMATFLEALLNQGFTENELITMAQKNPSYIANKAPLF